MENVENNFESRESVPMMEPITDRRILELRKEIEDNLLINLDWLPIIVSHPGEFEFDLYEAQTKLYNHIGSWPECVHLLRSHGYDFNNVRPGSEKIMRQVALENGVILDDRYSGFAWNIGGRKIIYMAIREDDVVSMANRYAVKEQDTIVFTNKKDALEYIRNLAEKYFFHEIGHTFHLVIMSDEERQKWRALISSNTTLIDAVNRVQADKHPQGSIPVAAEAFADIFSKVASNGKYDNRLGTYEGEETYVRDLIDNYALNKKPLEK